ncbi:hypothetical protein C7212DRAFT_346625 [Tuber magnatum]|uniref:Uncharacterized protein n=1 Tax=Tuber magnatum TaxID=42249 RepID=A0A317SLC3_9PEZI|nr:hypothetical protein C7212DRAFT_346625 [Tuber magnatum]
MSNLIFDDHRGPSSMSQFISFDSLQRENWQLRNSLGQMEEAYELLRKKLNGVEKELKENGEFIGEFTGELIGQRKENSCLEKELSLVRKDYKGSRSVASSQLQIGSLAKSTFQQLQTPLPERAEEKEEEPEMRPKRSWATGEEERKWQRVESLEPVKEEEKEKKEKEDEKGEEKEGPRPHPEKEEGFSLPVMVKVRGLQ